MWRKIRNVSFISHHVLPVSSESGLHTCWAEVAKGGREGAGVFGEETITLHLNEGFCLRHIESLCVSVSLCPRQLGSGKTLEEGSVFRRLASSSLFPFGHVRLQPRHFARRDKEDVI